MMSLGFKIKELPPAKSAGGVRSMKMRPALHAFAREQFSRQFIDITDVQRRNGCLQLVKRIEARFRLAAIVTKSA